jgi:hypothetical protein
VNDHTKQAISGREHVGAVGDDIEMFDQAEDLEEPIRQLRSQQDRQTAAIALCPVVRLQDHPNTTGVEKLEHAEVQQEHRRLAFLERAQLSLRKLDASEVEFADKRQDRDVVEMLMTHFEQGQAIA